LKEKIFSVRLVIYNLISQSTVDDLETLLAVIEVKYKKNKINKIRVC
jgi:hypothetical protein